MGKNELPRSFCQLHGELKLCCALSGLIIIFCFKYLLSVSLCRDAACTGVDDIG